MEFPKPKKFPKELVEKFSKKEIAEENPKETVTGIPKRNTEAFTKTLSTEFS